MLMKILDSIVYNYKLGKGDFDESDKNGSFVVHGKEWVGKIWPQSDEYRIVEYEDRNFNRFGLQAKTGGSYVDVMVFDDGYDDYGKLNKGQWKKLSDICSWSIGDLKLLRNAILGIPETPKVLDDDDDDDDGDDDGDGDDDDDGDGDGKLVEYKGKEYIKSRSISVYEITFEKREQLFLRAEKND